MIVVNPVSMSQRHGDSVISNFITSKQTKDSAIFITPGQFFSGLFNI